MDSQHHQDNSVSNIIIFLIIAVLFAVGIGVVYYFKSKDKELSNSGVITCKDVTSIDYNWNNDVLCTRPDGTTFYTNYAGVNKYGYNFPN